MVTNPLKKLAIYHLCCWETRVQSLITWMIITRKNRPEKGGNSDKYVKLLWWVYLTWVSKRVCYFSSKLQFFKLIPCCLSNNIIIILYWYCIYAFLANCRKGACGYVQCWKSSVLSSFLNVKKVILGSFIPEGKQFQAAGPG